MATNTNSPLRKLTVVGTASVSAEPDELYCNLLVSASGGTMAKAKAGQDRALMALLKYLRSLGKSIKSLQTGSVRLGKTPVFLNATQEARREPFACNTTVTFTLLDLALQPELTEALVMIEGVQSQGTHYGSSQAKKLSRQALKEALVSAKEKATDLAAAIGCKISKPLEIITGANPHDFMSALAQPLGIAAAGVARGLQGPAPVPGKLDFSASVTIVYDMRFK